MPKTWAGRRAKRDVGYSHDRGQWPRTGFVGFTLVELLVVIAIVLVLVGLIFPAAMHAQERAAKTKCLSNTREVALATANAFGEMKDELLFRSQPDACGEAAEQLLPYLRNILKVFDCPANPGTRYLSDSGKAALFKMPSYDFWSDYELNGYLCSCPSLEYRRQCMITDYSLAAYVYDYPYQTNDLNRAHEGGVNCGYLDGHAVWLPDEEMHLDTEDAFFHGGHAIRALDSTS